jgi:cytochrome c biogenesis protein CcdA/thiol-disulfide isomerase/thioredoxin
VIPLLLLAALGGVLAVASPCVLPVLPFVLARAGRSLTRDTLPFLLGLMLTFAAAGSVVGAGSLAIATGAAGRWVAPVILAAFALVLLWPSFAERVTRPVVSLGARLLPSRVGHGGASFDSRWGALITGAATGLIWAPCAGPILALVLVGAAVGDLPASQLPLVLLAFATGSASVFALVLILGDIVRKRFQDTWLRVHRGVEIGLGVTALGAALLVLTGTDAKLFARVPTGPTAGIERTLVHKLAPGGIRGAVNGVLPDLGPLPSLEGGLGWINSAPLSRESLHGKVAMIEIWTFMCYNCLNALPHVKETAARYKNAGLVTIGVHAPELPRERPRENVEKAVKELGVTFPVVLDNNFVIWKAFNNEYWPSVYVVDRKGRIRFHHDGEGSYKELDEAVATLLAEKP